eukprot:Em0006g437a
MASPLLKNKLPPLLEGATPLITPASGAIPLGRSEVEYTCLCGGLFQQWLVTVPSLGAALALVPDGTPAIASLLRSRGIATALGKPYVLLVNATSESNGSSFVCTSIESGVAVSSTPLTIVVYDRPDPPVVKSVALGVGTLLLSWSPASSPLLVNVTYYVSVADPNDPAAVLLRVGPIVEPQYVYQCPAVAAALTWCNRYLFAVMAKNDAGESDPSQPIISISPSDPQFNETPTSRVRMAQGNVTVQFISKAAMTCPGYPVQNYSIHIYDTGAGEWAYSLYGLTENDSKVECTVYGLTRNARYSFLITAVNEVGSSSTSAQIVYTTDVQSSTITGSDHQLNVTCFFAEGTLAKGCVVCLEKSGEVVYQMIPRVNGIAKGVIRTEFSVDCYNISVMDWEEDGSIGSLYIPTIVSLEKQEGCVSFTGGAVIPPTAPAPLLVVASSAVVGGCVIVAAFLTAIVMVSLVRARRRSRERRLHEKLTSSSSLRTAVSIVSR